MSPEEAANVAVIRQYFDACGTGDLDQLLATLDPEVVHYFLPRRFPPIRGAQHLAKHWRKFKTLLDPAWAIDRILARGDEAVTEWSCLWTPPETGRRVMMRGSEWYVLRAGRIAEIRAYLIDDPSSDTELAGFPYGARGYLGR